MHNQTVTFAQWLEQHSAVPDIEGLIPFTRWLTPANLPKRYSTQMYLYFLPLDAPLQDKQMHIPTPDGGVEHTAAKFLYAEEWIEMARRREIVLFPPQFFLLDLIAPFLSAPASGELGNGMLLEQRERLRSWVATDGDPPWGEKCISPNPIKRMEGWLLMGLGDAGPEVEGMGRKGDEERGLRVELDDEVERGRARPRPMEVVWRRDVLGGEDRGRQQKI